MSVRGPVIDQVSQSGPRAACHHLSPHRCVGESWAGGRETGRSPSARAGAVVGRTGRARPGLAVPDEVVEVGAGLQVKSSPMEADVAAVCGPRGN
jgi:hypothetical protein